MHNYSRNLLILFTAIVLAASAHAAAPSGKLNALLAELGYQIGAKADHVVDYQLDDRKYVNKKNMIVPDASSRNYLVTFREPCDGMQSKKMLPRRSKIKNQISVYDTFVTKFNTWNLALCQVRAIHELEPL